MHGDADDREDEEIAIADRQVMQQREAIANSMGAEPHARFVRPRAYCASHGTVAAKSASPLAATPMHSCRQQRPSPVLAP